MRKLLSDFTDEPIYNMKAVEQQTHIPAATLRAWERRYGLMMPKRTPNGYRLYSDRDVALLRWVRSQMDAGLTISRVVAMMTTARDAAESIWVDDDDHPLPIRQDVPLAPANLVLPLVDALSALDDERADEILEQAFSAYTMPTVYVEIIAPALVEIGEAWHRGDIFIATEHYASSYLRGRLLMLLHAYTHHPEKPMIFVGCAPNERHEVGPLIFAVMLRQQGYNVVYLGQDVPLDDVFEIAHHERPALLCLSASSANTAIQLRDVQSRLTGIEPPTPIFAYGGRAFDNDPDLRKTVPGNYLGSDPRDAMNMISNLLRPVHYSDKLR